MKLVFFLSIMALSNARFNGSAYPGKHLCELSFGGHERAVWENGVCRCKYKCASDPPICNNVDCHGAPKAKQYKFGLVQPKCDTSMCPAGRRGECCEEEYCMNGGKKQADGSCNCDGTEHIGKHCQVRIKNCKNGGKYEDYGNLCSCSGGYTGPECEELECFNGFKFRAWKGVCDCEDNYEGEPRYSGRTCSVIHCRYGHSSINVRERRSSCSCNALIKGRFCDTLSFAAYAVIAGALVVVGICICLVVRSYKRHNSYRHPVFVAGNNQNTVSSRMLPPPAYNPQYSDRYQDPRIPQSESVVEPLPVGSHEPTAPPAYEEVVFGRAKS